MFTVEFLPNARVSTTKIQILAKDGRPALAIVPIEIRERVRGLIEDAEDIAAFDAAMAACHRTNSRNEQASARHT